MALTQWQSAYCYANNKYLELYMKQGSSKQQREKVIKEWYRQTLKNDIPALITKWQTIIDVVVADWGVKFMRTKWGTCNIQAKRIWLNLELAKKPRHCLEYVIVHEMVHLLERHHNERHTWISLCRNGNCIKMN